MCMVESADEMQVLSDDYLAAKKEHKCCECHRVIEKGETYERTVGVIDGRFTTYKTCMQCCAAREWLQKVCSGWVYTSVEEDLREHFYEGYGMWVGRAAVGMARHWRRRNGSLMEPMKLPAVLPIG